LKRGFWLYVWEITPRRKPIIYYVGRTGDSSSSNAQSPFNRMGHHLGFNKRSNVLRRRLQANGIDPEQCEFRLIAHGPILKEASTFEAHCEPRNVIASLEAALAVALKEAGYEVMNTVNCRMPLDNKLFKKVRSAFATEFPKLSQRKRR
jgi:hypothetical protein